MSVMLALAACGGGQPPVTKVYTSSQTITIPANVSNLALVSGQGAPGTPAETYWVFLYSRTTKKYVQRNDLGGTVQTFEVGTTYNNGYPPPNDYCDPPTFFMQNGVENAQQFCYTHQDVSYQNTSQPTTGANATGFGQTFPGGVAGPAVSNTFKDVAVTPGGSYALNIPAGGSISISYYA